MAELMTAALVSLDDELGADKDAVIAALAARVTEAGRATDVEQLRADLHAREAKSATGMKDGIAIPHCRSTAVTEPTLAFARLQPGVDFGAKDGVADLVFLIAAPEGGGNAHLQILAKLARSLVKPEFTDALRSAATPEAVVAIVQAVVDPPAAPAQAPAPAVAGPAVVRRLVAVTSCPTGIAHTYMAAEALEAAASRAGVEIAVETQGSAGSTPLPAATIAAADAVVFATDVGVRDKHRFAGKPVVSMGVKRPIDDGDAVIAEALRAADDPAAARVEGSATAGDPTATAGESWGGRARRVLMTGVSYMIPFVAAGGLLIALGFLLGGYDSANVAGDILVKHSLFDPPSAAAYGLDHVAFDSGVLLYLGVLLFVIGKAAFALFVPALAGYIAYAIADRPGLAPGFIMGALATNLAAFGSVGAVSPDAPQTGFIGAIVGGTLAGVIALWVSRWRVPTWARGLMPVLVIPLVTSIVAGLIMLLLLGRPITWLMERLSDGLNEMSGSNAIILGVVLGMMMAFDMGGPLNKVAYSFAVVGIGGASLASDAPELKIMAAVMLAGMVPPLALALATVVRPNLFTSAERENGKAAWLLGASFISEGAIPFAAADPLRVIPSIVLGSAVTGGLAEALDVSLRAPHGGIFVLFAVDGVLGFFIALVAGTVVAAAAVVALKSIGRTTPVDVTLETVAA
ncbi:MULTISPECIES: fructose-specific PTS transporter subunit EIIC [unclassified Nocardioides]|uniref:PTS fructose transporter subunit IIABC n=1 Tax=unclassified Nocardioides TaxID=2615069 RepID=UPI000702A9B9|nr:MULTISPECIES: fructose-specific PTS transporter subunit EIIC [unclassified Nocardioides]KRC56861.1 PTS lactose transporter subunit IIC [Nocardioides sp. Root79]KRC77070.1 PTS lactose transporter subunit IIC [Nocardioides sp. Root240]